MKRLVSLARLTALVASFLLIDSLPTIAQAKPKAVYPVALLRFDDRGAEVGSRDTGSKLTDLVFAKLVQNNNLYLVDRADLDKAFAELALNASGAVDPGKAIQVGHLAGAKLLVTGSVVHIDKGMVLIAKIIGTETSRVTGVSVEGVATDDLSKLADKLATGIGEAIEKQAADLVPEPVEEKDRIAALGSKLKDGKRPDVWIHVSETHFGSRAIDPAAETELSLYCQGTGFTVIDVDGKKSRADVLITGEGFSETAGRMGGLVAVKARVEIKAVDRKTDKVLAIDRETAIVVDATENLASKAALQEAAASLAERMLPKLLEKNGGK